MYSPRLHRSSNSLNPLEIPLVKAPRARPSQREPAAPGANGASPLVAATPSSWPNTTLRLRRGPLTEFANGIFNPFKPFNPFNPSITPGKPSSAPTPDTLASPLAQSPSPCAQGEGLG